MEVTNTNLETVRVYHTNYVRNYRAVAVMWAIFTICFAIINIVAFIYPQWIGDTLESPGVGYFGLYEYCSVSATGAISIRCDGQFTDFATILSAPFKAATFFIGFSALLTLITIVAMLLFFFISTKIVFLICAWLQLVSALCMFLGCVIYPSGWKQAAIQQVCGPSDAYEIGNCGVRWSYILAIIGIFDAIVLCALAFVLATRQAKMVPTAYSTKGYPGYENGYIDRDGHVVQPELAADPYDEYITTPSERANGTLSSTKKRGRKGEFSL